MQVGPEIPGRGTGRWDGKGQLRIYRQVYSFSGTGSEEFKWVSGFNGVMETRTSFSG